MRNPMQIKKAKADAPLWVPQVNEMCEFNSPSHGWVRCKVVKLNGSFSVDIEAEVGGSVKPYSHIRHQNLREGKAPASKKDQIVRLLKTGEDDAALKMAAKFPDLGEHKAAITKAANALNNPEFYRQIKQDPSAIIIAGVRAMKARYLD